MAIKIQRLKSASPPVKKKKRKKKLEITLQMLIIVWGGRQGRGRLASK